MARPIVTEEIVATMAHQLAESGEEPSIVRVQALIGGGSFSTVKRYLDAWKAQRQAQPPAVAVPAAIVQRAEEFGRQLWQEAAALASQETATVREEFGRQLAEARTAMEEAEQVIGRLEAELDEHGRRLEQAMREQAQLAAQLQQAQLAAQLAESRREEQAQRVADVQRQAEAQAAELAQARAELGMRAQLVGELEAMRRQIAELSAPRARRSKPESA